MKRSQLNFDFPENLIAQNPATESRVMVSLPLEEPFEVGAREVLNRLRAGDVLVVNDTKVIPRRIFGKTLKGDELEVLFLTEKENSEWEVLFPSRRLKKEKIFHLPDGITAEFLKPGRPQLIRTSQRLDISYFEKNGEMPLPPYIQVARDQRHTVKEDRDWYQTDWAHKAGSSAAPTASLHFKESDMVNLKSRGIHVFRITLHVGLGTFLPVEVDDLNDHPMHSEWVEIDGSVWEQLINAKKLGGRVWALGTTVARALESVAKGKIPKKENGFIGETDLLIQPGFHFEVVDVLMTNFHQPESTLLALVCGFAGVDRVKSCYRWAIENEFRLFSYGDLSVWDREC